MNHNKVNYLLSSIATAKSEKKFYRGSIGTIKLKSNRYARLLGKLEFGLFAGTVCGGLAYASYKRDNYSPNTRFVFAGLTTHIIVDMVTYLADRFNSRAKTNLLSKTRESERLFQSDMFVSVPDIKLFDRNSTIRKKVISLLLNSFRGIQAAFIYLTFNSIIFFGMYKKVKSYLQKNYQIEGFANFFISAGLSQFCAMIFVFPLENLKTRIQVTNFKYNSLFEYYYKLFSREKGKPNKILKKIKTEYSGFFSHLALYVIYEAFVFAIYESMIKYFKKNNMFGHSKTRVRSKVIRIEEETIKSNMQEKEKEKEKKIEESLKEMKENSYKNPDFKSNLDYEKDCIERVSPKFNFEEKEIETKRDRATFKQIMIAAFVSSLISGVITNPIDLYQINKQLCPSFKWSQLSPQFYFIGLRERIWYLVSSNLLTFGLLEEIGPRFYNITLEED